jgi:Ca2+-binding RTX toxin-like protein
VSDVSIGSVVLHDHGPDRVDAANRLVTSGVTTVRLTPGGTMKLRAALAATTLATTLAAPFALALTGAAAPSYAATMCQGKPATIEGSNGILTGTEGDDVIVAHGTATGVQALGGNDLICVEGGNVAVGLGDDSVVSTAPSGSFTSVSLVGGNDSYVSEAGSSEVIVDAITSFHADLGGGGTVQLDPTSTPGTGTIHFGTASSHLYAFGERRASVDLSAKTANVDGLLEVTMTGLRNATATGCKVRMRGNDKRNDLDAYGHDVVVSGGGGRDLLRRVGNGFDLDLPRCARYKSVFLGQGGPDRLSGRLGADVLIGGPGHDVADGAGGVDTCRAEVRKHCER